MKILSAIAVGLWLGSFTFSDAQSVEEMNFGQKTS
jgi:hypothetical protein